MIISLNWLKKFTNIDMPVEELATLIGARLVEIEEAIDFGAKYKNALVVKVVEAGKLEGSDHLSVTKIDDGGFTQNIERDEAGMIQVVCGAPNIKTGQMVVWLPPESIVPNTFGQPEPFILGVRQLRGVTSNGMIASARELDLFDEHDGILELDNEVAPGTLFADAYELNDYLLDIENKSLTHRPDCFGIVGFAREVAAIQGTKFVTPDWLMQTDAKLNNDFTEAATLSAVIDDASLSDRYQAIVMAGADSKKQSPLQVQTYLARVGVRPINAIVDVTNYLMMVTGQPLHAFDYDKLVAVSGGQADIHVRAGRNKETLELLDGKVIELTPDDIVIAAGETAIGLAGAMGGANTAIDENTQRIIIESATFNLYKLRATQMRHGIFSEAITRFTKGQPAELAAPVLLAATHLMEKWSGAKCVSEIAEAYPGKKDQITLEITAETINGILGSSFNIEEIINTLENVEFKIEQSENGVLLITAPYWRADIHIIEDIAEEIGRLNGFDSIKLTLPMRDFTAVRPVDFDTFRNKIREILVRAGANEVLAYSFVHGDIIKKSAQDVSNSYRIVNSISPSLQYYRQTLSPCLLDLVHPNIKQGFDSFAIFELNKTHKKASGLDLEGVPVETDMLALVITNKEKQTDSQYYKAKRMFDYLCESLGVKMEYEILGDESEGPLSAPFEGRRTAVVSPKGAKVIGLVGEFKKSVIKGFKLPDNTAGFEINTRLLFDAVRNTGNNYVPISRYPSTDRDICFKVSKDITFRQIVDTASVALKDVSINSSILPVDIYQPEVNDAKNITIRVNLVSSDYTLTSEEVTGYINTIISSVIVATNATVI